MQRLIQSFDQWADPQHHIAHTLIRANGAEDLRHGAIEDLVNGIIQAIPHVLVRVYEGESIDGNWTTASVFQYLPDSERRLDFVLAELRGAFCKIVDDEAMMAVLFGHDGAKQFVNAIHQADIDAGHWLQLVYHFAWRYPTPRLHTANHILSGTQNDTDDVALWAYKVAIRSGQDTAVPELAGMLTKPYDRWEGEQLPEAVPYFQHMSVLRQDPLAASAEFLRQILDTDAAAGDPLLRSAVPEMVDEWQGADTFGVEQVPEQTGGGMPDDAMASAGAGALPEVDAAQTDCRYQPASWFTLNTLVPASRLRVAASPDRQGKRVRTRVTDGVILYSVEDATRWWASDMQPKRGPEVKQPAQKGATGRK